jgi:hypothetical protein
VTADPARTQSQCRPGQPGHTPTAVRGIAGTVVPVAAGRRWRKARNVVITVVSWVAGGSAGCLFGRPVLAAAGVAAVILAGITVTVLIAALLGRRDPRSPFERLMLLLCVITDRRPGDYLPPL